MFIQVNKEYCDGCGVCLESCPVGAIQLLDHVAAIDETLCTQCEACLTACPNGAIAVNPVVARNGPNLELTKANSSITPISDQVIVPEKETSTSSLPSLVSGVLTFLGHEVAPRLVDVMFNALERRLIQPVSASGSPSSPSSQPSQIQAIRGKGMQRQKRYRGGRAVNRNYKERR